MPIELKANLLPLDDVYVLIMLFLKAETIAPSVESRLKSESLIFPSHFSTSESLIASFSSSESTS